MSSAAEDDDIDDVAAQWVLRQDRGALSPQEQTELDAWLESNSRHRGAFVRAQAMWFDLDRVAALNVRGARTEQPIERRQSFARAASVVAVFLTALAIFAATQTYLSGREATGLGEMRRIALSDGSAVALNTASVLQVKFASDQRRILMRRGEASFQVAHDVERPFIVEAGDVSVRAVGTAFNVRMRDDGSVDVVVTEGIVEVTRDGATATLGPQKQRVVRNHEVIASAGEPLETVVISENDLTRRLAWKQGQLVFDGERLDQAVAEVNRYATTPVLIESEQLAAQSFVGVFRTGDARAFAYAAAAAFNARVREDGGTVYLTDQ